jgi:broad specificity phosphatase PhoE
VRHLFYLRHGESVFNKTHKWAGISDPPLTEHGRSQSQQAGKLFRTKGIQFDCIYSSPLSRALDTAQIFANQIGFPSSKIIVDKRLVERCYGELEGTHHPEAAVKYLLGESHIDSYKNVEKFRDLQLRANQTYEWLQSLSDESILVVSHGAFGRALWRAVNNKQLSERGPRYGNAELVHLI